MRTIVSVLCFLTAFLKVDVVATVFSDIASGMKAEAWMYVRNNLTFEMTHAGPTLDKIYAYGSECLWDPVTKQLMFVGSAHGAPSKFIVYDALADSWREEMTCREPQTTANRFGHAYDMRTLDTDSGIYWVHTYNGGPAGHYLFKYHVASNKWDSLLTTGTWDQSNMNSIGYFPDLKRIISYSGKDGAVRMLDPATRTWMPLGGAQAGGYEVQIQYNSRYHCMVLGGGASSGDNSLYTLDTSLTVRRLTVCAQKIGSCYAAMVCDPGSGDVVVFTGTEILAFSMESGTWRTIAMNPAALANININQGRIMGTIEEYNVHVILNVSNYNVLLYKHTAGGVISSERARTRTSGPSGLRATPNPFNPSTRIMVTGAARQGKVAVYDLNGRVVARLSLENGQAIWNAGARASGTYLVQFIDGQKVLRTRISLIK